jgi:hypothetical protein
MFLCSIYYEHCISYLRYGNTWGDWHGGNGGGGFAPFEIVLIGANGIINLSEGGTVDGIVFWGNDGTNYGPYGGPSGNEPWETTFNSALGKATN